MTIHNEYPLVRLGASEVPPDDLGDGDDTVAIAERGAAARALDRWLVNSVLRDGAVPQGLVGLGWIKNYGDRADSQVIKPLEERLRASVSSATAALDAHGKLCGALDLVGDEVDKEGVKAQIRDVAVRNRLEWMEQQIARTFPENSPVVVRSGNTPWSEEKLGGTCSICR